MLLLSCTNISRGYDATPLFDDVALELHALREETVGEFLALLRAHGAREERLLYPWSSTVEAAPCEGASSAPPPGQSAS